VNIRLVSQSDFSNLNTDAEQSWIKQLSLRCASTGVHISVRGRVDPRVIVRLRGLYHLKILTVPKLLSIIVGIVIGYELDGRDSIPDRGKGFFSTPQCSGRLWDTRSLLYYGYRV
jgi:hypothetical protein